MIAELLANKVFLSVFIAWALAQFAKMHLMIIKKEQKVHLKDIFLTGGMPSSHSSVVVSLVLILFLTEGITDLSVLSLVLALIVIRDAMGVRRTAGEEGKTINRIIRSVKLKIPERQYALGHTPLEVLVGAIIGIISSLFVYFFISV
ncbi:hypothetical protein GF336_04365 [Candidatus Woesearchaeota archaeon]|nr:hypothetical protein [Candidatus Woesearchaeota archaeon]